MNTCSKVSPYMCSKDVTLNSYKIGAWNANGWTFVTHPENVLFKKNVLKQLDLDIYLLSETHFLKNEILVIEGFKVIQFNRVNTPAKAVKGSGGVAIALNQKLLRKHKILTVFKCA